jgi:hypothetical protein
MSKYPRIHNYYASIGQGASGKVTDGDGIIHSAAVCNLADTDRFFMVFDRDTLPTIGLRPLTSTPVYQKNGYTEIDQNILGQHGFVFDDGLVWGFSTSGLTYQPAAATDGIIAIYWS